MKIGIITCFDLKNVNFGNRLQTYALNAYLNNTFEDISAETLYFQSFKDFKRTKMNLYTNAFPEKLTVIFYTKIKVSYLLC